MGIQKSPPSSEIPRAYSSLGITAIHFSCKQTHFIQQLPLLMNFLETRLLCKTFAGLAIWPQIFRKLTFVFNQIGTGNIFLLDFHQYFIKTQVNGQRPSTADTGRSGTSGGIVVTLICMQFFTNSFLDTNCQHLY